MGPSFSIGPSDITYRPKGNFHFLNESWVLFNYEESKDY